MWKGNFKQHYNSAADVINLFNEDYEIVKKDIGYITYIFSD